MSEKEESSLAVDQINLLDQEFQECPYPGYEVLRNDAPVWKDPLTGFFVVTRYEDLRAILLDTKTFGNASATARDDIVPESQAARMHALYKEKGWVPAATLAGRDDPEHKQMRAMFDEAFKPSRIKAIDSYVEETAHKLVDAFIDDGKCEWVKQMAVPLPLMVIGKQMGAKEEDLWQIKAWTDAWIHRLGLMQSEDEERWSVEMEIEAQHYFQPIFEELRKNPNDTLLSELVNREIPEWGRALTDNELHAEMMADTFVGGSETTTNALSAGIMLLIRSPETWEKLKDDQDKYLRPFIEEVVRLESPVQGLFRTALVDTELHGVAIPKDAVINVRYAAANRDEREFECPEKLDVDRQKAARHLGFGSGTHHCLGAPLARRELWWGFKAFFDRVDDIWFIEDANDFSHVPNLMLRALKELQIGFKKR